jgi:hypothetical protein
MAADVLRVIGPDRVRMRELPMLSGVSRQAVAMAVNYLVRRGFAQRLVGPVVELTPQGLDALEAYWKRANALNDGELRAALEAVLSQTAALSVGFQPPEGCWRLEKAYLTQTRRLVANPRAALPWQPMVLHRGGWPDGA